MDSMWFILQELPTNLGGGVYPIYIERFQAGRKLRPLSELKLGQAEYYYLWHEYAIMTDNLLTQLGY